jgi:hypothetical protein
LTLLRLLGGGPFFSYSYYKQEKRWCGILENV